MITGISIKNVSLFGKRVDIELAPITLLFGRNSSGKSSVLQALEYARRVVVEGDTSASGKLLSGFSSILHQGAGSTELAISARLWRCLPPLRAGNLGSGRDVDAARAFVRLVSDQRAAAAAAILM